MQQGRLQVERIEGERIGSLVFLHEGLGSIAQWRDFPRSLCAATKRAGLVYDRFGYGGSSGITLPRPLSFMQEEATLLGELLARERLDDVILVGHSDGASIALIHAASRPRNVRGVIAIAPHVFVEPMCVASIAKIRAEYDANATDLRARLARYHGANVDGAFLGWSGAWLDPDFARFRVDVAPIDVPVLVIQGASDPYGTLAQVDAIASHTAARVESLVLTGGHSPHREHPREVEDAAARFVSTVVGSATVAHA